MLTSAPNLWLNRLRWSSRDSGFPVVMVNPTAPVGDHDFKPTPTGRIIVEFLLGKMPAFLDTGLNVVDAEDVAEGHLLAFERGLNGERYILGCQNMTLKSIFAASCQLSAESPRRLCAFLMR